MNDLSIILFPVLFGLVAVAGFAYGVWQRQMARHDAERAFEKRYQALQEEYQEMQEHIKEIDIHDTLTLCYADGLEQELEYMTADRDECNDRYLRTAEQRDEARKQRDELNVQVTTLVGTVNSKSGEIAGLHAREKLLIETMNKQQVEEEKNSNEAKDTLATHNQQPGPKTRRVRNAQQRTGDTHAKS
jgi:hypothetical protein